MRFLGVGSAPASEASVPRLRALGPRVLALSVRLLEQQVDDVPQRGEQSGTILRFDNSEHSTSAELALPREPRCDVLDIRVGM
jgi:hypothetical protein